MINNAKCTISLVMLEQIPTFNRAIHLVAVVAVEIRLVDLILVMAVFIFRVAAAEVVPKLIRKNCLMPFLVEVPDVDGDRDEERICKCMCD
mmetsp:Transcript_111478/g.311634  ORF Transcript_111478/g.311634 Transcript_111478/m.311634 type:complete len:91 (+) Transcript_111478:540-812(+)